MDVHGDRIGQTGVFGLYHRFSFITALSHHTCPSRKSLTLSIGSTSSPVFYINYKKMTYLTKGKAVFSPCCSLCQLQPLQFICMLLTLCCVNICDDIFICLHSSATYFVLFLEFSLVNWYIKQWLKCVTLTVDNPHHQFGNVVYTFLALKQSNKKK